MKKILVISIIAILGIWILTIFFFFSQKPASAQGDWLAEWGYRVKIPVSSISGGQTGYQTFAGTGFL